MACVVRCVGLIKERNQNAQFWKKVDGERLPVNFIIYYEIDQEEIKTVLRMEEYGGDADSSWVLLQAASDAGSSEVGAAAASSQVGAAAASSEVGAAAASSEVGAASSDVEVAEQAEFATDGDGLVRADGGGEGVVED